MDNKINLLAGQLGELRVKRDVDLSDYLGENSQKKVSAAYIATSVAELTKAIGLCKELKISYQIIGSGSKINLNTFNDVGLLIKNRSKNLKIFGIKGKVSRAGIGIQEAFIEADTGVSLSDLADFSNRQGLTGFEDLQSAQGTVGGSILYNRTILEKAAYAVVLDDGDEEEKKDATELDNNDIVLKVIFHLKAKEV